MTPRRYELTDFEWSIIAPLLPNKPRGVPRADDRLVLNGIYWRLRTGSPWADIRSAMVRRRPATTALCAGARWVSGIDLRGGLEGLRWRSANDRPRSGFISTRPTSKRGSAETDEEGHDAPARYMGRLRGGPTTKIHALVDANGNPIALKLTEGQAHDGKSASDLLKRPVPGQTLLADRAYDSDALRESLAQRGAWANIKPMPGARQHPGLQRLPLSLPQPRRAVLQ